MRNISLITFLLISNLIFSQNTQPVCQPMFNSNLFSFEGEELDDSDPHLVFRKDKNYQINFDSSEFMNGNRSICIKGLSQTTTHAKISIYIPIKIKRKSKIELSAWVKTDSIRGKNSGTILQLLGYGNNRNAIPTVFKFSGDILKGSRDWTKMSLSTILKEDEHLIALNILMQGKGKAWFDNFELKINGEKINDILFFKDTEGENQIREILKKYIFPINIKNSIQISDFIYTQKNNVRVIGLGEATHGTKEIYEYKAEIIKSLIKNNGVRKIALEARYANAESLNTYVLTGKGNLKKAISETGFWLYNTVEFKNLLIWLKKYNKKTKDKISIIGIDSQPHGISLKRLTKKLKDEASYSKLLRKLNSDSTKIPQKITISNALFQKLLKSNQNKNVLMNARELSQSYFLEKYIGNLKYNRFRDSLMAVNIEHLEKKSPSNEKIIYWAHDNHIQKKSGWAGDFLNKKLKDSYVNIGFLLGEGKYNAVNLENRKLNTDNYLTSVNCNSLENLISTYNGRDLLFNYNSASKDLYLMNNLFNKYLVKRSIGAGASTYQFNLLSNNEENSFDLLVYIENSSPSQFLK